MPQLGAQDTSGYPQVIDTRMIAVNAPNAAPKSASRVDKEWLNSLAHAIINLETTLGTNPQGNFGSLAARLQQFMPGGSESPALFPFTGQTSFLIPGTTHRLASSTLKVQVYDSSIPAQAIEPDEISIDQTTHNVTISFLHTQSGTVILHGGNPQYVTSFDNVLSITIPGTTHGLETGALLVSVFTDADPLNILTPGTVTVNQSSFDVVVTFAEANSGVIHLSASGPRYVATFSAQTTVTIPGTTHQLGSRALLFQVYDAQAPAEVISPDTLTVDPNNFNVTLTFLTPQSGTVVLVKAETITGTEFVVQDAGIPDSTAVRMYSQSGTLNLQFGAGDALRIQNKHGTIRALMDADGKLGLGTVPAYQLHLTGDAAKPGSATWLVVSDARMKEVLGPFTDGLATLLALNAVRYRYNGQGDVPADPTHVSRLGLLAQEVAEVAPYMVQARQGRLHGQAEDTSILSLDLGALPLILPNACKELMALLTEQTCLVQDLQQRVTALETIHASHQEVPHATP